MHSPLSVHHQRLIKSLISKQRGRVTSQIGVYSITQTNSVCHLGYKVVVHHNVTYSAQQSQNSKNNQHHFGFAIYYSALLNCRKAEDLHCKENSLVVQSELQIQLSIIHVEHFWSFCQFLHTWAWQKLQTFSFCPCVSNYGLSLKQTCPILKPPVKRALHKP